MEAKNQFSSRFGFIAAAAGCAVGLGNIWKFPFEVGKNGGAAFLILYLVFCFVLCYPILVAEIAIGRRAAKNPAFAFGSLGHKKWTILGILFIIVSIITLSFYVVVSGWALSYFVDISLGHFEIGDQFTMMVSDFKRTSFYSMLFLIITGLIVGKGIHKGIEGMSKIMMPVLIGLIIFMVIYAVTLPGAMEGLKFYLLPDFSKVNLEVILSALGHAFFSLSLGLGALITYGSYFGKDQNILSSAAMITMADIGVAFLAGLMLFPLVFSQGLPTDGGAGLVFVALPGVFENIGGVAGLLIGAAFFMLLTLAALTSAVSLLEIPVSYFIEKHRFSRFQAVVLMILLIFVIGIPSLMANGYSDYFTHFIRYIGSAESVDFMTFISDLASNTFLPLGGFFISLFVGYRWNKKQLYRELLSGIRYRYSFWVIRYISFGLMYVCPSVLGLIFTLSFLEKYLGIKIFA